MTDMRTINDEKRVSIEDIDQFSLVKRIPRDGIRPLIENSISGYNEDGEMERFIREIIADTDATDHNSMEIADIITHNVTIQGEKVLAAFVNKGKSFETVKAADVAHQFNKAERIQGLNLLVFAAVGRKIIDEAREQFYQVIERKNIKGLFLDRKDLARLFIAYKKACPEDGKPLENGKCPYCGREVKENIEIRVNIDLGKHTTINHLSKKLEDQKSRPISYQALVTGLELERIDAKSKLWHEKIENIRSESNKGLKERILPSLNELLLEVDRERENGSIVDFKPIARIYRVAASILMPMQGGDPNKFEEYLAKAMQYAHEEELEECKILDSIYRAYCLNDLEGAVHIINNVTIEKAKRIKFGIFLDFKNLSACDDMITAGLINPSLTRESLEWTELFAFYYLKKEQFEEACALADELLKDKTNLNHLKHAAVCLYECGLGRLTQFYKKFNVPEKINVTWLPLRDLKNHSLIDRAAKLCWELSEIFKKNQCSKEERQAIEMALNFSQSIIEDKGAEVFPEVIQWQGRLEEIVGNDSKDVVTSIILNVGKESEINLNADQVKERFKEKDVLPESLLFLVEHCAKSGPKDFETLAKLLEDNRNIFESNISNYTLFTWICSTLWEKAGRQNLALACLNSFKPTGAFSYTRELNLAMYELEQNNLSESEKHLLRAIECAPDNPVVLGFSMVILAKKKALIKDNLEEAKELQSRQVIIAKRLFELLPTETLMMKYLELLYADEGFDEILRILDAKDSPKLPDEKLSKIKYQVLMALYRYDQALAPLQWLCEKKSLGSDADWVNLSIVYRVLGKTPNAIHSLEKAIEINTKNVYARKLLTQFLLGVDKDRAYKNAVEISKSFPDDEELLANVVFIGFETGHEVDEESRLAFKEFQPGGKFSDSKIIKRFEGIDFLKDFIEQRRRNLNSVDEIYKKGAMPLLFISSIPLINRPLFALHKEMIRWKSKRYFAAGEQYADSGWLLKGNVNEIVVDYHALLTIWELFKEKGFELVGKRFKKIYIPDTFLPLLTLEEDQLMGKGQPREEEKRRTILDLLHSEIGRKKIIVHDGINPDGSFDFTGHHTEQLTAKQNGCPYLCAFEKNIVPEVVLIGFKTMSKFLQKKSLIDNSGAELLEKMGDPQVEAASRDIDGVSELVLDLITLSSLSEVIPLQDFFNLFNKIHISQPALEYLRSEVGNQEFASQIENDIKQFRLWIEDGMKTGFLEQISLAEEDRMVKFKDRATKEEKDLEFRYYFDLFNIATNKKLPIWTDDFATRKLALTENPNKLSTDVFLAWLNFPNGYQGLQQVLSDDEFCRLSLNLVDKGYHCLALNIKLIFLLLNKCPDVQQNHQLEKLLDYYRNSLNEVFKKIYSPEASIEQIKIRVYDIKLGQKVFHFYNESIFDLLRTAFRFNVRQDILDYIFSKIAFMAVFPSGQEKEKALLWLRSLLSKFISFFDLKDILPDQNSFISMRDSIYPFSEWMDALLQRHNIDKQDIDNAWMGLVEFQLNDIEKEAKSGPERLAQINLILRFLACFPDRTMDRISASSLGEKLKDRLGITINKK